MNPRSEKLRQRAVALGLIQDDGPQPVEVVPGITEDEICDQLEELLDAHEDEGVTIVWMPE